MTVAPSDPAKQPTSSVSPLFVRHPALGFAALVAVNAMWAFQFSGARIAARSLSAVLVTLLPMVLATLCIAPFVAWHGISTLWPGRKVLIDVVLLGVLGIVPAQLLLVLGVERTLASNASVIGLTVPIFMTLSAFVFLGERMTRVRWISFAIAIIGVMLISGADIRSARLLHADYMAGNFLILLSCAGSAFYNSYSRRALTVYSPAQVLLWSFAMADCALVAIYLALGAHDLDRLFTLGASTWLSLLLIAIFSLGISMLLYFAVIQSVEVMQASLSIYLLPVFGVLFSSVLLHENLTPALLAGAALIFASSFLITVYEQHGNQPRRKSHVVI